jgi:hypothetical protein
MLLAKRAAWQGGRQLKANRWILPPETPILRRCKKGKGGTNNTPGFSLSRRRAAPLSYGDDNGSCAVSQKSELSELELLQMQGRRNTRVLAGLLLVALLFCVLINQ